MTENEEIKSLTTQLSQVREELEKQLKEFALPCIHGNYPTLKDGEIRCECGCYLFNIKRNSMDALALWNREHFNDLQSRLSATRTEAKRVLESAKYHCDANCAEDYRPGGRHAPDCWLEEVEDLCQAVHAASEAKKIL